MESFVTAAEVAKYLSLSPRTIAKMARESRIPAPSCFRFKSPHMALQTQRNFLGLGRPVACAYNSDPASRLLCGK
jgi:hypothetical protein